MDFVAAGAAASVTAIDILFFVILLAIVVFIFLL